MQGQRVIILGGGLAGMATALALGRAGWRDIVILEQDRQLGGLAGSFERDGKYYPLGYHHINCRDHALLYCLDLVKALPDVRWRNIRMFFNIEGRLENLGTLAGFLRFPMALPDKARFVRMMLRAFAKRDWTDWEDRSAAELIDAWAGPGVRRAIFEDLTRVKFDLPCAETSAAWLGARLYTREGSSSLGYIPGNNWTKILCDGLAAQLAGLGVNIRTGATIGELRAEGGKIGEAVLTSGERFGGDIFVSALPTETYASIAPADRTPGLESIRYTALLSAMCATRQTVEPDFYWMVLTSPDATASGIFMLQSLNPTIGQAGESVINFMTHLQGRARPLFGVSDAELLARYMRDFRKVFGFDLEPAWTRIIRLPLYSPIFARGYRNPPVRSSTRANVFFAGNYRTFPSSASTGTAIESGFEAARNVLRSVGENTDIQDAANAFRPESKPKG